MMSHLVRPALASALLLVPGVLLAEPAPDQTGGVTVTVTVKGLRNTKGLIRACLTQKAATFPECEKDPASLRLSVPASNGPALVFRHVPAGTYAVSLFHDANANNKLDTFMGIPSEGFGFSRDAPVKMAPPKFAAAQFAVGAADVTTAITVRYIL
ncbi:DUF2141 domain-containing protein [Novosphingobium sp.]|uniref:DUF2141 domain-containing protein n=1 Tax=Novosphingobium sp. TaxID=1874826 RepID=UPI003340D5CE